MLYNVIKRLSEDTGWHLVDSRDNLVDLAQRAAKELYSMLECNRLDREVTLVVPRNSIVSLPSFVGEIKGIRQHTTELLVDYNSINQPRYTSYTWKYNYKNWRDYGETAVHTLPSTQSKLTLEVAAIESTPVDVLITGHSSESINTKETVTLSFSGVQTVNIFGPEIYSIVCLATRTHDITIKDESGNELAILYADSLSTSYKLIDVSMLVQPADTSDGSSLIDVAYKVKPTLIYDDADMFYTNNNDYDDAWFYKAMELFCKPLQGREADTAKYAASCLIACKNNKHSQESSEDKKIVRGRNKYHGLFNRYTRFYSAWPRR